MELQITIARPAAEVFDFLADIENLRHWLPQLRREESSLPETGLEADAATRSLRWSFDPTGRWRVTGEGEVATLHLTLDSDTAPANDPTEEETPRDAAAHGALAALHSLKSHLEHAGGGDPDLHMPDVPHRVFGHDPS